MVKLRGKRALVTGSTAGIGFAIANGLAREGGEVIVNGCSEARVADAVARIAAEDGAQAIGIAADLGTAEGVARLAEQAGRVDILVNKASSSRSRFSTSTTAPGSAFSRSMS